MLLLLFTTVSAVLVPAVLGSLHARGDPETDSPYLNDKTKQFLVNGSSIPAVGFDVGESYAGRLSNSPAGNSSLFFWFFPSDNPDASDEITIWLNGGPGCSSLAGFLRENGPFLWQPGTPGPYPNPYSWTNLTNMVWVDQPAGTGLSPGPSTVRNEDDVAKEFLDFWRNFVDAFQLQGRKIYLTGESYAGMYIPYIGSHMLDEEDRTCFDLAGAMIYAPFINSREALHDAPAVGALNKYHSVLPLNDSFMNELSQRADKCGFNKLMTDGLVYPLNETLPTAQSATEPGCNIWLSSMYAAAEINPCFSGFHLTNYCPFIMDVMNPLAPNGGPLHYFNHTDVREALHVPDTEFSLCKGGIFPGNGEDPSAPTSFELLPKVTERTNNTILGHGWLDYQLLVNGTLLTIQNMTWNGAQGFQSPPDEQLYVPHHIRPIHPGNFQVPFRATAGSGILGTAHTERGLTFTAVDLAGHPVPQFSPGAAYTHLEFLLGRIDDLSKPRDYTTVDRKR